MDNQKQIEEMAKEMVTDIGYGCAGVSCDYCEANIREYRNKSLCENYFIALKMMEKGYRKIPEGAVVLTREELEEKIDCCDVSMIHHDDDGKRYIKYEKYKDFTDRLGKRIQQLKGKLKQEREALTAENAELKRQNGELNGMIDNLREENTELHRQLKEKK